MKLAGRRTRSDRIPLLEFSNLARHPRRSVSNISNFPIGQLISSEVQTITRINNSEVLAVFVDTWTDSRGN